AVMITAVMLYNRHYNRRLRSVIEAWAAREGLHLEQMKTLVVWRGLGQRYQRGDGVYALRVRRLDGAGDERLRVCLRQEDVKRGPDGVVVESRAAISHLDTR
ncbi:hypothetical protein KKB55_07285, partial [Myxococcota bacterium]|nr:hypothetical protein [Myxococcota bacterium]